MNITVIGTGYVGLVTGVCFSEMGNHVRCVDIDAVKIGNLENGIIPIHEPGLEQMARRNTAAGLLSFTTSLEEAMKTSFIYFIAVGTPPEEDGSADLRHVLDVARKIGRNMTGYSIVVNKSTVPVGTGDLVRAEIARELEARSSDIEFDVVSNPEFLKEGDAVQDFMRPDRIVLGIEQRGGSGTGTGYGFSAEHSKAAVIMQRLYAPFTRNHDRIILMGIRDAEMTKYAANSMLASRISFMNEIAGICELTGADVENVRKGIGSDSRIGYHFIYPGCGYGGSCFPKDVKALIRTSEEAGFSPLVLNAVEERNRLQKKRLFEKAVDRFGINLSGMTFAVWGLAFKPGTDDMREASSVVLVKSLVLSGAVVRVYDPVAMENAVREFPSEWIGSGKIILCDHQYEALRGSDAMFLVTEWKPFRQPDFAAMKKLMNTPVIFDGRNLYEPSEMADSGFEYHGTGRQIPASSRSVTSPAASCSSESFPECLSFQDINSQFTPA